MISVDGVSVVFLGGVRAVDGLSLEVERGGFLAVVGVAGGGGPSGATAGPLTSRPSVT